MALESAAEEAKRGGLDGEVRTVWKPLPPPPGGGEIQINPLLAINLLCDFEPVISPFLQNEAIGSLPEMASRGYFGGRGVYAAPSPPQYAFSACFIDCVFLEKQLSHIINN